MRRERAIALIGLASALLSVLLAVAVNVATGSSLPAPVDTFAWLSWPAVGVLAVIVGWPAAWQHRLDAPGVEPGGNEGTAARPAELPAAPSLTKALSESLGHSDPGLTLKVYAHLMPSRRDRARKALGRALRPQDPRA
ncbi:hypothetical protein BX257_4358 [Streptomyces sp. 3212.3]|jgi:hypothetical protein|uniref:hypothetical protein n=1 Tax=unclassified Streptomyces TaxID=2593676 RepID=UPI00074113BC|nr:hypothetical protein ADL25_08130 [Streptomyces sp. NRRL F-5122]REE61771.1 hypothetical protein BX257_4358 [Streptomyces sp. 3212.3]